MSSDSRKKREELKEQYKTHYRKMRETRERFKRTQKKRNIVQALKDMDSSELMESFDDFLFDVKSKVAMAEARLDVALESLDNQEDVLMESENEESFNKMKARDTLKQLKNEMGLLYRDLNKKADAMDVQKTVGKGKKSPRKSSSSEKS